MSHRPHIIKTDRGFGRAEFKDLYGQECSIQKSSLATKDALWLGVDRGLDTENIHTKPTLVRHTRMHIDREMAEWLWPVLKRFAKTGELEIK